VSNRHPSVTALIAMAAGTVGYLAIVSALSKPTTVMPRLMSGPLGQLWYSQC
jgi:hypothetical protein